MARQISIEEDYKLELNNIRLIDVSLMLMYGNM